MKKLLLISLLCLLGIQTQASHLMGGQITSKNIGGLTYEITLTLYRDTLGIPMSSTQIIAYTDSTGNYVNTFPSHTINYDSSLTTNIGNGVERYVFKDTVTFPYVGKFRAEMENCCRNAAILNLPNPSSNSLWLDVDISADPSNSSPVFLNEPITVAQHMQPFVYNPAPFDADGDSLSWQMDVPMDYFTNTVGIPIAGYTLPPSDTSAPFSLDPLTGEITFIPSVIGNFQISVMAIEWRNGVQIGYIRRDMQLIVVPSPNTPVNVTSSTQVLRTQADPSITLQPGDHLVFTMESVDYDAQPLQITACGSAFMAQTPALLTYNPAFTIDTTSVGGPFTWTSTMVEWTPTQAEVRTNPYFVILRISEWYGPVRFSQDLTVKIQVTNSTTGLDELSDSEVKAELIRTVDAMGREISPESSGFRILQYSNGKSRKVYVVK